MTILDDCIVFRRAPRPTYQRWSRQLRQSRSCRSPNRGPGPNSAIYRIIVEANIFRMMADFYRELEKSEVRPLFLADTEQAFEEIRRVLCDSARGSLSLHAKVRTSTHENKTHPFRNR